MGSHDLVVIGSSAGGIAALMSLCAQLPADLPAAICIVQHSSPDGPGLLPQLLANKTPMTVTMAVDGMPLTLGTIHIAPPDRHLLVELARLRVVRGPRENLHRPSIDPLFRSAATTYGERVVGVVLTGMLSDGTAGLHAIKKRGGVTMVQDPQEAKYASMPIHALHHVDIDYCLPLDGLAQQLVLLAGEPTESNAVATAGDQLDEETPLATGARHAPSAIDYFGSRSIFTCPECNGAMWEMDDDAVLRFRCHTGHAFSGESLAHGQTEVQERSLWAAVRALEEQAALLDRLGKRAMGHGEVAVGSNFDLRAELCRRDAMTIRRMLMRSGPAEA